MQLAAFLQRYQFPLAAVLIFTAAFVFFVQNLGIHGLEYRDDEIFYFKSAGEMIRDHNWLSPTYYGENRFQKPILFYWLVILSTLASHAGWVSARLVSVFFAALTVTLTWILARLMFRWRVAALSCLILATFPMFFRHAKNVVPDMTLNFFIVAALLAGWLLIRQPQRRMWPLIFFAACALGFMVKGFAAIVVPFVTMIVFVLTRKRWDVLRRLNSPAGLVLMALIILPWFIYMGAVHGGEYFDFMLRQETRNRLINPEQPRLAAQVLQNAKTNAVFYAGVLATHFSPWSLFILPAGFIIFRGIRRRPEARDGLAFLAIWLAVVLTFFVFIFFHINHYLLVLSTPLAIALAYFFSECRLEQIAIARRSWKGVFIFLFMIGLLSLSLVFVYLAGLSFVWLVVYGLAAGAMMVMTARSADPVLPPALLGLFLVFVLFQSQVISRSGLCPHTVYRDLARSIAASDEGDVAITVASHSLHEKELQVYFDQKITKTGHGYEPLTRSNLLKFLQTHDQAFFIITAADYERYADDLKDFSLKEITREDITRKSYALDKDFLKALFRLDRSGIRAYIMQPILLMRKDHYG